MIDRLVPHRVAWPRDGTDVTVSNVRETDLLRRFQESFIFCLKKVPKTQRARKKKKNRPGRAEPRRSHGGAPYKLISNKNHVARAPRRATCEAPWQFGHGGRHATAMRAPRPTMGGGHYGNFAAMCATCWDARGGRHAILPWRLPRCMRCMARHVAPTAWRRPSRRHHVPHHATNASIVNRHAAAFAATWRSATSGISVALPATTICSNPHFSLLTNLFALPLPYSSRYPLPSSTCEVPIGTCQVFRL